MWVVINDPIIPAAAAAATACPVKASRSRIGEWSKGLLTDERAQDVVT